MKFNHNQTLMDIDICQFQLNTTLFVINGCLDGYFWMMNLNHM
jgi:hypothetical protein